ncbi:similar to cerebellin 1 precursor protein, isoform CRA_a [Rattus norvegicus]|uniref:Similar to cerebellin 1 protein, isoform CRA_a n=1 Tax=Rattus norvegicus TaxID=10116 RepID=A6KDB4_RAT|nr:similar to cerebellin 1 precursor protein, isoform CRA_a [Rattus norvegicus]
MTQILLAVTESLEAICCPPSIPNASGIIPNSSTRTRLPRVTVSSRLLSLDVSSSLRSAAPEAPYTLYQRL